MTAFYSDADSDADDAPTDVIDGYRGPYASLAEEKADPLYDCYCHCEGDMCACKL
jgi:hypothetical protein